MTDTRQSKADEPPVVTNPEEIAALEARNALRQFDAVVQLIEQWTSPEYQSKFKLRPSLILQLHRLALEGLSHYAGTFRPADITITGSSHKPLQAHLVPGAVDDLCDYVNDHWSMPPLHLAAYVLWRLNWIHAFTDGNGRTSRALSYLVLCVRLGYRLPGTRTIPELIAEEKAPYYKALEAADGDDFGPLEGMLAALLAKQLLEVHRAATGQDGLEAGPHKFH